MRGQLLAFRPRIDPWIGARRGGRREPSAEIPGSCADGQGGAGPQGRGFGVDHRPGRGRARLPDGDQAQDPLRPGTLHPGQPEALSPAQRPAAEGVKWTFFWAVENPVIASTTKGK